MTHTSHVLPIHVLTATTNSIEIKNYRQMLFFVADNVLENIGKK